MNDLPEPRDVQCEERLLASMMFSREALTAGAAADITASDFTAASREIIFDVLREVAARGDEPDLAIVFDGLRRRGQEVRVGGALELARLADLVPSGASVARYAAIVREYGHRRRLMRAALSLYRRAADLGVDAKNLAPLGNEPPEPP